MLLQRLQQQASHGGWLLGTDHVTVDMIYEEFNSEWSLVQETSGQKSVRICLPLLLFLTC